MLASAAIRLGVHSKPLAADETRDHASRHDPLEHAAKGMTVAKALVAGARECRVIGDAIFDA